MEMGPSPHQPKQKFNLDKTTIVLYTLCKVKNS
jgi:hypothetical protein